MASNQSKKVEELESELESMSRENAWLKARITEMQKALDGCYQAARGSVAVIQDFNDIFNGR